jgi:cyclic pyranopterin phosphate synthase
MRARAVHAGRMASLLQDDRALVDGFGRRIDYVRLSVTDRCDLRCLYCMPRRMRFLPRADLLTADEIVRLARHLIARGVRRIRLTGGEPLVRPDIGDIVKGIGQRIGSDLEELTLTTNGTQLERFVRPLREAGVERINVSLDSRDPPRFARITRGGELVPVLRGIAAARDAGFAVKINMVALAGLNEDEIEPMLLWCAASGLDLTLIETMPLGEIEEDRSLHYLPLDRVRRRLERSLVLRPSSRRTGGPARYFDVDGLNLRLGFITPLTGNFCGSCNRIRVTAAGTAYGCLGRDQKIDLREALRGVSMEALDQALDRLIAGKPQAHDFRIEAATPAVSRHMNVTGG